MRKFSRIGATALALALSVTFLTPTTVLAAEKNYGAKESASIISEKTNDTFDNDLITEDVKVIGEYETYTERNAAWDAAGYENQPGYSKAYKNKAGKWVYVILYTQYKNEITGAVSATLSDVSPTAKYENKFKDTVYIKKGEVTLLTVHLINGDTSIKKVKSSKKKVVTATIDKYNVSKYETNANVNWRTDEAGNHYYYTTNGTKVILPKDANGDVDETSNDYKNSNASYGYAGITLVAKKAGTSNVSFDIYNKNGVKTGSAKVKVVVKDDYSMFKTFTYAGKSLIEKTIGDTKYINYGRSAYGTDSLHNFTDKAKGKLVVKANKGYKIVKIEVGTLSEKAISANNKDGFGNYYNVDDEYQTTNGTNKTTYHPVDLNGDGDYLDEVNGITENTAGSLYTFKKVKSGKTIKLSKVGTRSKGSYTTTYKESKNANGELITEKGEWISQNAAAPTIIRITYYDQESKYYDVYDYPIYTSAKIKGSKKK